MKRLFIFLLLLFPIFLLAQNKGYYRFPTLHGDKIAFTAEGDLWLASVNGGLARRLTTHHGSETHAAFSPDGKLLAFSAQYEGPTEVYTMPVNGGLPTRQTHDGTRATVVGWTPDGKILYSTRQYATLPNTRLVEIDPRTNAQTLVPLNQASDGVFNPVGATLFFTRLPFQGSHTKRYEGGTAQNIWKYALAGGEAIPLTADYPGTSKQPMWWNGRIYFISDRDGTMNLWSMKEDGRDLKQHTFHKGLDIGAASLDDGRIVYQLVADLYLYDIKSGEDRKINITLASDFDQTREKWVKKPLGYLTSAHISPDGNRVVLTARGQVFVAPAGQGRFVRVTRKNGVRYRNARFLPKSKSVFMLSDETGELEFWKFPANGVGPASELTRNGKVFRFDGIPSPDGKWIAFGDKDYQLWLLNVATGKTRRIAVSDVSEFSDLSWSPDSRWLAYDATAENLFSQIMLYHLSDAQTIPLTDNRVDSYSPAWSPDGKWLYFLSDRNLRSLVSSPWGPRQPEPFFAKTTKIYAAALTKDQRFPFLPTDEIYESEKKLKEKKKKSDKKVDKKENSKKKAVTVAIDLPGLQRRVFEVPAGAGNFSNLSVNDENLFFIDRETSLQRTAHLKALKIGNKKPRPKTLLDGVRFYELSLDGKKLLVRKNSDLYVIPAANTPPAKLAEKKVDLSKWTFSITPRDEWRQMFREAWRLERDYFYDPHMHGADYTALLKRYMPYVDRVTDREELSDLISNIVGELSALHTFVVGGDIRRGEDQISPASLGARLVRDEPAGGYRIAHIYASDPDYPEQLSPLAKPGLNIREGDVITAINGVPTLKTPAAVSLENQAGQQVLLQIKPKGAAPERKVIVKPITQREAANLRYSDWEYSRRLIVEKAGKKEIGYVHLRAMGGGNYSEWAREFYPVFNRQGLIIDVRHNRGGNIDSWILEKLLRKAWFYWKGRRGKPTWNMQYAFRGHIVVLCDEFTASDGEAFTEGFKRLGLGKVIGTRTWGGEIWLSFSNWLVDRGIASAAEWGVYGPEGKWLIEGHGVEPDIVVDNLPHATFEGKDAQLQAAIQYLEKKIAEEPVPVPPPPAYPNKSPKKR